MAFAKKTSLGAASFLHRCIASCGNYLSGMRAWSQSPRREAEGLSRLHNTITDWPDSEYGSEQQGVSPAFLLYFLSFCFARTTGLLFGVASAG